MCRRNVLTLSAVVALFATSVQAADPTDKCHSGKLKESAKYASCRLKAESKAVLLGGAPDFSKCMSKFPSKFNSIEAAAGMGVCPSEGDGTSIDARITQDANDIAILLAGGTLSDCATDLADCTVDLGACNTDLGACGNNLGDCESLVGLLKTAQQTCYDGGGAPTACAGTGQDGEFQAGVARSYTDNGDGTITDNVTGLMWEKLADDGGLHDKDTAYNWANAVAVKIAQLNAGNFAGYNDWRLPNYFELVSLLDFSQADVLGVDPMFRSGCIASCSVTTCSCTYPDYYWSSTTRVASNYAARARFTDGLVDMEPKSTGARVRAVRGGISVPACGNAIAEGFEECDGIDLDGASCLTLGYNLGGTLGCTAGCSYDTTACAFEPALPASGQTTSYGAGDDGDIEAGATLTYVDNGDGTITDTTTGLMWEKKILRTGGYTNCAAETGSCANPHHADNAYTWRTSGNNFDGNVVTIFLEQLNNRCDQDTTVSCTVDADCAVPGGACGFAGHQDWRLPNRKELESIVDASTYNPAVAPAFNGASCGALCTDLADPACSCTASSISYWSSTTYAGSPALAWYVGFYGGTVDFGFAKGDAYYARAVRGGF